MATWTREFSPNYEVPKFIPFLINKGIIEDMSWHNDASPSFGVRRETANTSDEVRLWVAHPFQSMREYEDQRFLVTAHKNEEQAFEHHSDDLDDALLVLFGQLAEWYTGRRRGPLAWHPDDVDGGGPWTDPRDYLSDLKNEYLKGPYA